LTACCPGSDESGTSRCWTRRVGRACSSSRRISADSRWKSSTLDSELRRGAGRLLEHICSAWIWTTRRPHGLIQPLPRPVRRNRPARLLEGGLFLARAPLIAADFFSEERKVFAQRTARLRSCIGIRVGKEHGDQSRPCLAART
jgi:hypothetical protein